MKRQQQTNEQLCTLARLGDTNAQNLLIENNLGFIRKTAHEIWSAQAELNQALHIEVDELMQEGIWGLYGCIDLYDPTKQLQFITYAAFAVRNAMLDYVRSQSATFEARNLNSIVSLDEILADEGSRHIHVGDPARQSPEQIYLAKERLQEIHHALDMISDRDRQYLHYRFGFHDDREHPLNETARHFHLSTSRAAKTEKDALNNVRRELPWRH